MTRRAKAAEAQCSLHWCGRGTSWLQAAVCAPHETAGLRLLERELWVGMQLSVRRLLGGSRWDSMARRGGTSAPGWCRATNCRTFGCAAAAGDRA